MTIKEIRSVTFVGAGTMGCFNSLLAGIGGYDVTLFDVSEDTLALTEIVQEIIGNTLVQQNRATPAEVAAGRNRIHKETDPVRAAETADLLSESVPERLDLKRSVHRQFDELCPERTIMTTNTSGIPVSEIEDAVVRGERFAAMHYHLGSPLVDLLGGPRTSGQTIEILDRYVKSINCVPFINKKENIGYVYNAILPGMLKAALVMHQDYGVAVEDIDRAWMLHHQAEAGPFGVMDLVGINVYYDGSLESGRHPQRKEIGRRTQAFLQPYIEAGELGMKTGKGIYTYPEAAYYHPDFRIAQPRDNERYQVIIDSMITWALQLVTDGVATPEEIDRVWMLATASPSGPFGWLDAKGIDTFLSEIQNPIFEGIFFAGQLNDILSILSPYLDRNELGVKSGRGIYEYPDPLFSRPEFLMV